MEKEGCAKQLPQTRVGAGRVPVVPGLVWLGQRCAAASLRGNSLCTFQFFVNQDFFTLLIFIEGLRGLYFIHIELINIYCIKN